MPQGSVLSDGADLARAEVHAADDRDPGTMPTRRDALSAQEMEIARLAGA